MNKLENASYFTNALSIIKPLINKGTSFGPSLINRLLNIGYQRSLDCAEYGVKSSILSVCEELRYEYIVQKPSLSDLILAHKSIFDNLNEQYQISDFTIKESLLCRQNVIEKLYHLDLIRNSSRDLYDIELLPFVSALAMTNYKNNKIL